MARGKRFERQFGALPSSVVRYVRRLVKMTRCRRKERRHLRAELLAHFADALRDYASPQESESKATELIADFGDPQMLAILCRRGKKRCRSLWAKAMAWRRAGVFVLVAICSTYTYWFVTGKPVVTDEYIRKLNRISRQDTPLGALVVDDAWSYYQDALYAVVEPSDELKEMSVFKRTGFLVYEGPRSLTDTEREAIESWTGKNSKAYRNFEAGSRKTHCHRRYACHSGRPEWLMNLDRHPPLRGLRWLAQLAIWKSRFAEEQGRVDEALEYCLVVARAGEHWRQSVMIIEQLIGWGMSGLAHDEIRRIVRCRDLDAATLQDFAGRLRDIYGGAYPQFNFEGERLSMLDVVQRSFTRGGPGGGHLLPGVSMSWIVPVDPNDLKNWKVRAVLTPIAVVLSMIHAGRDRTVEKYNLVYDELTVRARLSPYQRRLRNVRSLREVAELSGWLAELRYCLVHVLLLNESLVLEVPFRALADHEAVLTILALERYRLAAGEYPPDLQALVEEGYIDKVPDDPYSDGPLLYGWSDDDFILYGVGANFADDGGELVRDRNGRPNRMGTEDSGDMIFWPVYRRQVEK